MLLHFFEKKNQIKNASFGYKYQSFLYRYLLIMQLFKHLYVSPFYRNARDPGSSWLIPGAPYPWCQVRVCRAEVPGPDGVCGEWKQQSYSTPRGGEGRRPHQRHCSSPGKRFRTGSGFTRSNSSCSSSTSSWCCLVEVRHYKCRCEGVVSIQVSTLNK